MNQLIMGPPPVNQLQFNLNPLQGPPGLPARFRPPQPIIIEKYGNNGVVLDSMSEAVLAARQDLQQRKTGGTYPQRSARAKSPTMATRADRTRVVNSVEYLKRMQRRQQQSKMVIKERHGTQPVKNVVTQTFQQNIIPVDLPVRSLSPPTRDMTHEEKMMAEINRLRVEITKCLQQIKQFESQHPQLASTRDEDPSERLRRLVRAEEQTIRLGRIIYSLNKQISQLQEDLRRSDLKALPPSKKSQYVSRLASLHRAVVRALQICARHVSDADVCPNVLSSCRELAAVIRQLSLCYAQLEVVSDTSQPDIILSLINDIVALSKIADSGNATASLPKSSSDPRVKSQASGYHRLEKGVSRTGMAPPEHKSATDDRQAELRSRIQQLLKSRDQAAAAVHGPGRKKITKITRSRPRNRSVLIDRPSQLQLAIGQDDGARPQAHYAESTLSTTLKEQSKFQRAEKSPSSRERRQSETSVRGVVEQSPRHRSRSLSPSQRSQSVSNRSLSSLPNSPRSNWSSHGDVTSSATDTLIVSRRHDVRRQRTETTRSAWQNNNSEGTVYKRSERDSRRQSPQRELNDSEFWRPINSAPGSRQQTTNQRNANYQSGRNLESVLNLSQEQINRTQVSQSLLNDLVSDVSRELHQHRVDSIADRQSAFLRDIPSVSTLLQRLQDMEMEQDAIRQRWSTIVYDESGAIDANINTVQRVTDSGRISGDNLIVFTKPILGTGQREHVTLAPLPQRQEQLAFGLQPQVNYNVTDDHASGSTTTESRLRLSREAVGRIEQNVENYKEFLHRRSHNVNCKYNPWMALENIAEDILTGCIEDVVNEMDQINNEIVDSVYGAEFSVAR